MTSRKSRFPTAALSLLAVLAVSSIAYANSSADRIVSFVPGTSKAEREALAEKVGAEIVKELPLIDAVVFRFAQFTPHSGVRLNAAASVAEVEADEYRIWIGATAGLPSVSMTLRDAAALAGSKPDAPGAPVGEQPKPREEERKRSELPWGVARVGAPELWKKTTGRGVRVAVIDTGVDSRHPDLSVNYKGGTNVVDPEAEPMDDQGHGTHVAGTIAAEKNGRGVIGVAPDAEIYAVKVLDKDGGGSVSSINAGISWAVANKMHVANMSLGGPSSAAMKRAVKKAHEAGLTIVAAAGNNPEAPVSAPAAYPETIAVSASTPEDGLAPFSTTGEEVDVIAPGHKILSDWPESRLAELSGTSMACPHVAGLAALAYSLGARTPEAIRRMIKDSAAPLDGLDATQQGAGMPRAERFGR